VSDLSEGNRKFSFSVKVDLSFLSSFVVALFCLLLPSSTGANFFDMNSGGVLPKETEGICFVKPLTDCFTLTTFSGLERPAAELLIRISAMVSRVMELSIIL